MKKITMRQTNKLFDKYAHSLYRNFDDISKQIHTEIFPEMVKSKAWKDAMVEMIAERLMVEFQVLYAKRKEKIDSKNERKNDKKKSVSEVVVAAVEQNSEN